MNTAPAGNAEAQSGFRRFAQLAAAGFGSPTAFLIAVASIGAWSALGPFFGFSNTWQLLINTATTIITFLMVFLIQHTQNRDAKAIQLKLDELIRGVRGARTELVGLEKMSDAELDTLERQFLEIRRRKGGT